MKHCQIHGPEPHPYCVDCYKDAHQNECEECEGTGQRAFAVNCPECTPCVDCNGTGKVTLASESKRTAGAGHLFLGHNTTKA